MIKTKCIDSALPMNLIESWEQFFQLQDPQLNTGLDVYMEIFEDPILFPLQRSREMAAMMRLARIRQPKVVMEIGADKGGSFYHWVKCLPSVQKAICLEIRGTPYDEVFRENFRDIQFLFLPTPSLDLEAINEVGKFINGDYIDCLFIDGDKCGFAQDFWTYYHCMRPGSAIFLHDILGEAPPAEVFSILKTQFEFHQTIIDVSEGLEAVARQNKGEPIFSAYEGWLRTWKATSCGVGCIFI